MLGKKEVTTEQAMDLSHIRFGESKGHFKSSPRKDILCSIKYLLPFLVSPTNVRKIISTIFLLQLKSETDCGKVVLWGTSRPLSTLLFSGPQANIKQINQTHPGITTAGLKEVRLSYFHVLLGILITPQKFKPEKEFDQISATLTQLG